MKQIIFTESKAKASEFNQPPELNTILKYVLAHRIL